MSKQFQLSTTQWNELQKLYKRSKHSDFNDLDGMERMKKLKQDWMKLKELNMLDQQTAYILIIDQYKLEQIAKQNKRKREMKQSMKQEKDVKSPPIKRRRIGSKHKKHKTPALDRLNIALKDKQNDLDDVCVLLSTPNQSVEQIAKRQNKREEILKEIEKIQDKIAFRKENNESCKRCRYRKQVFNVLEIPPLEKI
eukprot:339394_1